MLFLDSCLHGLRKSGRGELELRTGGFLFESLLKYSGNLGHELEFKTGGFLIESLQLKLGKLGLARWISWISEPEIL